MRQHTANLFPAGTREMVGVLRMRMCVFRARVCVHPCDNCAPLRAR